jgi:type II secretory pathway pseudopilin PulG
MKSVSALRRARRGMEAFSLVEVVLALGICVFAFVALLGLYTTGLRVNRESEAQIQAADFASMLIAARRAAPLLTNSTAAIPAYAMTNIFTNAYPSYNIRTQLTNYIGEDGQLTNAANALYLISCQAGTNMLTGSSVAQVYLKLSWPPQANPANPSTEFYEVTTYIPFP